MIKQTIQSNSETLCGKASARTRKDKANFKVGLRCKEDRNVELSHCRTAENTFGKQHRAPDQSMTDAPVRVEPLVIRPTSNAKQLRSPQRLYSPPQRYFIIKTVQELENVAEIFKDPSSRWVSPALSVPKPVSDNFGFAVDYRAPSTQTEPVQSPMPHLNSLIETVEGSTVLAMIDVVDTPTFMYPLLCNRKIWTPSKPKTSAYLSNNNPKGHKLRKSLAGSN